MKKKIIQISQTLYTTLFFLYGSHEQRACSITRRRRDAATPFTILQHSQGFLVISFGRANHLLFFFREMTRRESLTERNNLSNNLLSYCSSVTFVVVMGVSQFISQHRNTITTTYSDHPIHTRLIWEKF